MDGATLKTATPVEYLVTPITPYLICNHFISTEVYADSGWKYIEFNLKLKANDLIKNRNFNDIKNYDIIQVQVDLFDFFYDQILPIIVKNNIKVVIITSQWHLPQIQRSYKTDNLLNNSNILLWISQNPIYTGSEKYMAFPYGIHHKNVNEYAMFMQSNTATKCVKILNQHACVHPHLPTTHIRKVHDVFGKNSGKLLEYKDYLKNILDAEFVISTPGDRDDSYRHYECIGLNAIPVSNIDGGYKEIFEENMVYSNEEEMLRMIKDGAVGYEYKKPNSDMLTISYWVSKIHQRIQKNM